MLDFVTLQILALNVRRSSKLACSSLCRKILRCNFAQYSNVLDDTRHVTATRHSRSLVCETFFWRLKFALLHIENFLVLGHSMVVNLLLDAMQMQLKNILQKLFPFLCNPTNDD
jgi:hypothetical protein